MLEQLYPMFALFAMIFGLLATYLTREIYHATRGSSEFWRFLSAFTGASALYSTFWFFSYIFPKLGEVIEAALWIALVAAALYAITASTFIIKLYQELTE